MSHTLFTLVHGTFAANSDWLNESAADAPNGFRAMLRARARRPVDFSIPPAWGSKKLFKYKDLTNEARLQGAEKLRQHILSQDHDGKHFMVAHSHGGNVAMYALQDPEVAKKVDGLICLATPFLYPKKRPLSILALTISLGIMLAGVMQFIWTANLMDKGLGSWLTATGLFIFAVAVPACLTWLVSFERYQRRFKQDTRLQSLLEKLSYKNPDVPILLIRASGDEASGLLRAAQFLNWLGGIGMRLGGRQLYLFICTAALLAAWMAYRGSDLVPDFVIPLLTNGLIISAAIMVVLLMALTLSRVFVGFDAWRWVGEVETMVEDGPPGIPAELVVLEPKPGEGLSHTSIYSEVEAIESIASWCEGVIENDEANLPRHLS